MPQRRFCKDAQKDIVKAFKEFIEYIYGGNCAIDSRDEKSADFSMNVPGDLKRAEFEEDIREWCDEHNCDFELIDQAPEAPSRQYFSENLKLMYPRVKNYEVLAKQPRKLEVAKSLFKKSWGQDFNEEDPDDQEDIVILYNEYMDELSEWKPVELRLKFKEE